MAYAFNAGTEKEIIISRYCGGGYLTGDASDWYSDYYWFCEYPTKFNVSPFAKAYYNDNTKNNVTLLKFAGGTSANYYMGLHFEQLNDVIKVYWRSGTNYRSTLLYEIPITALDNPKYILIIYDVSHRTGNTDNSVRLIYGANFESSSVVNFSVGQTQGRTGLIAETGSAVDITTTPSDGRVYDGRESGYTWTSTFATTESYYGTAPRFGFKWPSNNPISVTLQSPANLQSANGDAPDPVTPTPPTPPAPDDPNDEGNPSDEDGGDGDHEPSYDPVPVPSKPTYGAATAGFITMYRLTTQEMQFFATDMFSSNIWTALRNYFSSPMDFLVGINLLPFNPHVGGQYKPKYGSSAIFSHAYSMVDEQYMDIDCGSIQLTKYWGSCFDFEPYTKVQIWLPYIGYRDLPVDEIMGMTISVKYRCDCLTGDCVVFVYIGTVGETGPQVERIIAQFYGNCAVRIPFGAVSYDAAISNSIALVGAAASMGLSAGAGVGAVANGIGDVANVAAADIGNPASLNNSAIGVVQGMKPNVHKGGAAGASTGYMSVQKPYLIRRIPRQNLPTDYMKIKGYPSNIGGKLADFTGLAVVDDIQLNEIPAMEDERKEIMKWLKGGVLI